ncbi:Sec-independent protein translocase TatB [Actinomyces viscosus]|uniref:Sec-independent protein translocase protein TatB n=1 Tax=Actinomyces viscosus TaxID=1656 RepID=A0A448PH94_ACTVI|nr:twin-arginine translocase TatA/TatE family subunit [Actinomyces viscosus]TFH53621.1 Sec-independent protein translocase TatB [Actinomyces viscosus]VEI14341.1 Sec-independent protein translocase protein TatB [Actinomyces viscosus]
MFGISGSEFLVIVLVAVVVVGPQRLPEYTRKLTQLVRQLRVFLDNARSQIAEEVGPEMADLDLSSLDPRQYDPRKIVRDALGEDIDAIREDLAHPFRSVGSAAKEISDDAAKAVNDVVKQDRANSLSKQIEAKRAEQLAAKDKDAAQDTEKDAADAAQPAESTAKPAEDSDSPETSESTETSENSAPPQGVLQKTDSVEAEAEPEPAEPDDQAESQADSPTEPEAVETEQPEPAERAEQPDEVEPVPEPADAPGDVPVEVPASLAEPSADPEQSEEASEAVDDQVDDHANRVRPLSPRDIVRAANAAARTRAEAARVAVDF